MAPHEDVQRSVALIFRDLNRQIDEEIIGLALDQSYLGLVVVETWSSMEGMTFKGHARVFKAPAYLAKEADHHYMVLNIDEDFVRKCKERRARQNELRSEKR